MTPELCGEFRFWHANDRVWRTWHVWAVLDETGALTHIYLGNSQLLPMAQGPYNQRECTIPLRYRAWQTAAHATDTAEWSAGAENDVVIVLFDDPS